MVFVAQDGRMGEPFDEIIEQMQRFIAPQHMFFVATAPLADGGRSTRPRRAMTRSGRWTVDVNADDLRS